MTDVKKWLDETVALASSATPGPWRVTDQRFIEYLGGNEFEAREKYRWTFTNWYPLINRFHTGMQSAEISPLNANFIAASRTLVPALAEVAKVLLEVVSHAEGVMAHCYQHDAAIKLSDVQAMNEALDRVREIIK